MKRTLLFIVALMVCGLSFAKPVDVNTARQVAVNFWNLQTTSTYDGFTVTSIVNPNFEEISATLGVTGMYVFNTVDNKGFVIVSSDDAALPILGYSFTNGINRSRDLPSNLKGWLNHYSEEIAAVAGSTADENTAEQWNQLLNNTAAKAAPGAKAVSALIQTKWDQDTPYNNLCPLDGGQRSATGCVATAMAQVMKYWAWPTTGTGSHSYYCSSVSPAQTLSVNFASTTYDWSNMPVGGGYTTNSWNNTQKTAVATLMYHCGVSVDMEYTYEYGSGAYSSDAASAFRTYFGYANGIQMRYKSSYSDANWMTLLKNELDAGRPMMYGGTNSTNDGGHSFVCDGYNASNQFHFNWGWSGYGDGFFSLTSLAPGSGGIGGGTYDFTYMQEAITGISSPNGNPDTTSSQTNSDLATYSSFTVSSPVAYGSTITGSCGFANLGTSDFNGYLGVAAYNSSNTLVTMLAQTSSVTLESMSGGSIDISKVATSPLVAGTYTAKAVYSTDGSTWIPITSGYDGCATEVTFTITSNGGGDPDPGTQTFTLQTYDSFTLNNTTVAMGGTLTGTCNILNTGTGTFNGYVGVAAYNSSNQFVAALDYGSITNGLETNHYVSFNIDATISSPLTAGNYTLKAVYSTNSGASWTPITTGYGGCVTSVAFTVTGGSSTTYTINVNSANTSMGTVSGGGTFTSGQQTTISATPKNGYRFVRWNDNNTQNPRTITVTGNATYTAYFEATGTNAIDDVDATNVRLYPNPTSGMLTVDIEGLQKVEVIDAVGRIIISQNNGTHVDMSRLNNGIYSVRITVDGKTIVKKVAKQ